MSRTSNFNVPLRLTGTSWPFQFPEAPHEGPRDAPVNEHNKISMSPPASTGGLLGSTVLSAMSGLTLFQ